MHSVKSNYCTSAQPPASIPSNSTVSSLDAGRLSDTRIYICNFGYQTSSGDGTTTCNAVDTTNGKWSSPSLICSMF